MIKGRFKCVTIKTWVLMTCQTQRCVRVWVSTCTSYTCLPAIYISSLEKCLFRSSAYFFFFGGGSGGASVIAQLVKNLPAMQETLVQCLVEKIHWWRDRLPTPVFLGFPCASAGKESTCTCLFQFWFPRCVCPAVGLLGHNAVLFPVF